MIVLAAVVLGAIGALWTALAFIGREWDYCPGGSDCIAGELAGLTIAGIATFLGWVGLRLARSK
jgi:hypothetical protein